MFLERHGNPSAPSVILIHGVPGSPRVWDDVIRHLASEHHFVVPHLLGFGNSPRPDDLGARAQADALGNALVSEGVGRALFVGHDFGGPITLSLYKKRRDLCSGILLMATNAFPDTAIPFPLSLVNLPLVGNAMARLLFSGPSLRQMLRRYGGTELGDASSVRRIFTTALQQLNDLYREYPKILQTIDIPTSIVWGDSDPFFPVEQAERLAALVEGGELRVLENAGHYLPEQRHNDVAAAISDLTSVVREFETSDSPGAPDGS